MIQKQRSLAEGKSNLDMFFILTQTPQKNADAHLQTTLKLRTPWGA